MSDAKNDCAVEVDGNAYSVPWQLIGCTVEVIVAADKVRMRHGAQEVAAHDVAEDRRQRVIDPAHLAGVAGFGGRAVKVAADPSGDAPPSMPDLLRPLAEYEALVGGGFLMAKKKPVPILDPMLTRLQLTGIRDQLDSLLDNSSIVRVHQHASGVKKRVEFVVSVEAGAGSRRKSTRASTPKAGRSSC